jgi:ADP-ribose pyrophosphatase YjhB (NUDIX family)
MRHRRTVHVASAWRPSSNTMARSCSIAASTHRDGAWSPVEEAESVSQALTREVAEETGLRLIDHILFGVFSDPTRIVRYADGNTYRTITIAFVVRVEEIDALRPSAESAEVRLVPKGALGGLDLIATHRPIIDLYVSGGEPPYVD